MATETNELAIDASVVALRACTRVDPAKVTNRSIRRRQRIDRAIDAVGRRTRFVNRTVAIVVNAVANFRLRALATNTGLAAHAVALQNARTTSPLVTGTRIERHVVRRYARATHDDAVVDRGITIVIETVAELLDGTDIANAIENASGTIDQARDTLAFVASTHVPFSRERAVVDHTVAVVIHAVTRFGVRALRV